MSELHVYDYNIDDIYTDDYLNVTYLYVKAPENINLILNELPKFINLTYLDLADNKIKKIKGLDTLVNLKFLILYDNEITEINGLDNLVNLKDLCLYGNKITEIKGLDNLVKLTNLALSDNEITEIKGLDHLVNLEDLCLMNNKIEELKLNGIKNLTYLRKLGLYSVSLTKYLPNPIDRTKLLEEIKELYNLPKLYYLDI